MRFGDFRSGDNSTILWINCGTLKLFLLPISTDKNIENNDITSLSSIVLTADLNHVVKS